MRIQYIFNIFKYIFNVLKDNPSTLIVPYSILTTFRNDNYLSISDLYVGAKHSTKEFSKNLQHKQKNASPLLKLSKESHYFRILGVFMIYR